MDMPDQDILSRLEEGVRYIESAVGMNANVLIHWWALHILLFLIRSKSNLCILQWSWNIAQCHICGRLSYEEIQVVRWKGCDVYQKQSTYCAVGELLICANILSCYDMYGILNLVFQTEFGFHGAATDIRIPWILCRFWCTVVLAEIQVMVRRNRE